MVTVLTHQVIDYTDIRYQDILQIVSPGIRQKIGKYHFAKDRIMKMAGYQLLKYAIMQTGSSPDLIEQIESSHYGKPYIKNWYPYSLSYSGERVVLAYTTMDGLGIDLEQKKANIDLVAMKSICHPCEHWSIGSHPCSTEAFYKIWVKKEAVLKAAGTGLIDALDKIDCSGNQVALHGKLWYFTPVKMPGQGYICYLCTNDKGIQLRTVDLSLEEMM